VKARLVDRTALGIPRADGHVYGAPDLLVEQRGIMAAYLNVLNSRIYVAPADGAGVPVPDSAV
jgi:hypothetical protein